MFYVIKRKGAQQHDNQQHATRPHVHALSVVALGAVAAVDELRRHVDGRPVHGQAATAVSRVASNAAASHSIEGHTMLCSQHRESLVWPQWQHVHVVDSPLSLKACKGLKA